MGMLDTLFNPGFGPTDYGPGDYSGMPAFPAPQPKTAFDIADEAAAAKQARRKNGASVMDPSTGKMVDVGAYGVPFGIGGAGPLTNPFNDGTNGPLAAHSFSPAASAPQPSAPPVTSAPRDAWATGSAADLVAPFGTGSPDSTVIPPKATPTGPAPAAIAPASPPQAPGQSFLDRLSTAVKQHPATLMALGAGLAGAPSFGTGMSRAFAAAIPASQQDTARNMQMQGIGETYKALIGQGVSPQEALAAVYNPEVMKAMIPRLYGKVPTWGVVGHDENGNQKYGFIDTYDQTVLPSESVTKPRVASREDALRLPKGTHFIDPNGIERIR